MDKITNIDYRVLCYMKKLNSCFIDEIASKFGQAGLASIDNLDDLVYICMPYVSGLTDVIEGESGKTSSQMVSNCMMLTQEGEKAILDYKQQLKSQRYDIIIKVLPIIISFIALLTSICVAIYK